MNKKILVIDDEQGIRDLLSYELAQHGYQVATAANGEEGLENVRRDRFHLVICDMKMPRMDGLKTLEAIKRLDPDVEVIMATGFGTIEAAVASMKQGAYDFVQKPFNLDELLSLIEKALEKGELKALVALYEASKAIFTTLKLENLLRIFVDLSTRLLGADDVSIMLLGPDKKLHIAACNDCEDEARKNAHLELGERVAGKVAEWKESLLIVGPLSTDPRFSDTPGKDEIKSSLVCPLLAKTGVLGVMCVSRTQSDVPFNRSDLRYAQIFLSQVSQAIENAQLYQELEEKVEVLRKAYQDLSRMKDELVQAEKLTAIGELASGVAHELNNPLTAIIGLADLMLEDGDPSEERVQDFQTIKEQADRCRRIILNLLQFARRRKSEMQDGLVNEVLERTIELMQYDLRTSGIEIVKELDASVPSLRMDPHRMQQVFLNLITNARDAVVNQEHPVLTFRTQHAKGRIKVCFKDNGCGIPKDSLRKIFDPFFTTKEVGKGTGLGLSISFGIVKDHGGSIEVESEVGRGTTFCVELPCAESRAT